MQRYATIWCSPASAGGILEERLMSTFRRPGEQWDFINAADDDFLSRAQGYAGYVISGSPLSVVDDADAPMVRSLFALVRGVAKSGTPLVGVCFGAQVIAAALGGQVGRNPSRTFKLGMEDLIWRDAGLALLPPHDTRTVLVESHGECVTQLPPGSVCLAASETVPHEVFLVDGKLLGIQGHPEVDRACMQETFLPYHRVLFDDAQWQRVQRESAREASPDAVISLARRLLESGSLPTPA